MLDCLRIFRNVNLFLFSRVLHYWRSSAALSSYFARFPASLRAVKTEKPVRTMSWTHQRRSVLPRCFFPPILSTRTNLSKLSVDNMIDVTENPLAAHLRESGFNSLFWDRFVSPRYSHTIFKQKTYFEGIYLFGPVSSTILSREENSWN